MSLSMFGRRLLLAQRGEVGVRVAPHGVARLVPEQVVARLGVTDEHDLHEDQPSLEPPIEDERT